MFLIVPPQTPLPGVDTRPGAVRKWIDNLAYTSALETAHQLIYRLRDLHHQSLDASHRHELLLYFLQAFQRLHEPLRRQTGMDNELMASRLHTLDRLTEELLIGFKYVINDAQQERHLLRRPKHLHQALALAMYLISLLLATRYQSYLPTDSQLWREAGALLRYSMQNNIPVIMLDSPLPFAERQLEATTRYSLMAILRLTDPFRLPHATLWATYSFLSRCIDRIGLRPQVTAPDSPHARAVCVTCEPTEWHTQPPEGADPADWVWLDLAPLLAEIEDASRALRQQATPEQVGLSDAISLQDGEYLLKRLRTQWSQIPERKLPRFDSDQAVHLTVGLQACFYLHNKGVAFDPRDYVELPEDDQIDLGQVATTDSSLPTDTFHAYRCTLINRSAGGLAIRLPQDSQLRMRVGDLLAVSLASAEETEPQWLIATVRWLVNQPPYVDAGVQYIARDVAPCAVRTATGSHRQPHQPALRTTIEHNQSSYNLLITTKGMFRPGRTLELVHNNHPAQVKCTYLVESTGLYECFCYETL